MGISKQALLGAAMGIALCGAAPAMAQSSGMRVEYLDRGAVAVKAGNGMLVSWRALVAFAEA